jgi:hypothetical protein
MQARISFTSLILWELLLGSIARGAENEAPRPASKPLMAISGADSHVRKPSYERVTSQQDLSRVWSIHLGTSQDDAYRPLLDVDFDRCLVVAIFRGEQRNIRGIQINSLSEAAESVLIRFLEIGYQTAGADNNKALDQPYAFVVVLKTNKEIVLQQDIQNMKNAPPKWNEVVRLPARVMPMQRNVKP